jgi:hypothetical protein
MTVLKKAMNKTAETQRQCEASLWDRDFLISLLASQSVVINLSEAAFF